MAELLDAGSPAAISAAVAAIRAGKLVVLPTDTVYGLAADAFSPAAVARLLAAKGRGRRMPPPVLVSSIASLPSLIPPMPMGADALVDAYWPGPLTIVLPHLPSLDWDLGDAPGTVALRMPDDTVALALLAATGPLAVSSANLTGKPPALTAEEARDQLGDSVAVYLSAGRRREAMPSSIVDFTGPQPRLLRAGAVPVADLRRLVPSLVS